MTRLTIALALLGFAVSSCTAENPGDEFNIPPEEDDLVAPDGKSDTGYFSTLATELEGELVGELVLEADAEAREALTSEWRREQLVTSQLKFAKSQLNAEQLHLNLGAGEMSNVNAREESGKVIISYTMRVETIVSFEELRAAGIDDPAHLQDRTFNFRVPSDPRNMFSRAGEACAEGFDAGSLADYNYFYYFKPDKDGCEAAVGIGAGTFTVRSLLPTGNTYPEYDVLVDDGRVEVVAFYGAAGHEDEVSYWDWGMREWREFTQTLRARGFAEMGVADPDTGKGKRFVRNRAGLEEIVDVISPEDLHALNNDTDGLFGRMVRSHEIVLYLGHSFYGSLSVLDDPATYAPDTYQIFFIGSCWSYEYYTKQIFRNKANSADPTGWALADVVNDTETGWFHNNAEFSRIILTNVFAGAENGGREGEGEGARRYHWQRIIEAMNQHAVDTQRSTNTETHEIMGVSGVRTNRFDPDGTPPPPPVGDWQEHAVRVESAHPYANDVAESFEVVAPPGATAIRIHFERLATEARYDAIEVYDEGGTMVGSFDGIHNDLYTADITGSRATIRLRSDYSVTEWGFAIDHLLYRSDGTAPPMWTSEPVSVASAHPYTNDFDMRYAVNAPAGATQMRIHFTKIDTESRYDFVEVYDGAGTLVQRYDGVHADLMTAPIMGNAAEVRLVTDYSVTSWGFDVDQVEYQ